MDALVAFARENPWLCLGLFVIAVIVGDELLGVSRALLGREEPPEFRRRPKRAEAPEPDAGGPKAEDFLTPPR